ncbi:hypothetical protein HJC23_004128 [Cyclotella cryptica]|uniref:CRAL-TRIO domain-containing protein n=1 Tax=Cyclotella cryptica TaxID=29204 RepID=A0ABD3PH09_9STRA
MARKKINLGCAASLFHCFTSSKKKKDAPIDLTKNNGDNPEPHSNTRQTPQNPNEINSTDAANDTSRAVRFLPPPTAEIEPPPQCPLSPKSDRASLCSATSGGSVYLDALEDHPDFPNNNDDPDDNIDDDFNDSFQSLLIDGQFFFSARDYDATTDGAVSPEVLEGIKLYPPIPTTMPDPVTKYPISSSDMQTLLYSYQHPRVKEEKEEVVETEKKEEEANEIMMENATDLVGGALEHQAMTLMSVKKEGAMEAILDSTSFLLEELKLPAVKVRERGFPGELTEMELEAVKLFKKELEVRDPIYYDIVRSFSSVEKEAFALCRFLRARKFDVDKVFELLNEAKDGFEVAQKNNFYPDLEMALGFPRSVFLSQYPAVFSGIARNGCPVMYLRAGEIRPEGVKCLVTIDKVDRYFWSDIMHTLRPLIGEGRRINPNLVRCENLNIYDLKGISKAQITSDTFEMIKVGNQVMTAFPETLHCLLIINAPSWFGLVWSVAKKLIDPRTASKIEVFTDSKKGIARMNELIDQNQIPLDYGGSGPALAASAAGVGRESSDNGSVGSRKIVVLNHLIKLSKKQLQQKHQFTLEKGRHVTLKVYTRCSTSVDVTLYKGDSERVITDIDVVGDSDEEDQPYSRTIGACVGPGNFTIKLTGTVPGIFLILGLMNANDDE